MTKTDNNGVKALASYCYNLKVAVPTVKHGGRCSTSCIGPNHTPLISALDEADAVDKLCPCRRMEQTSCDPMDGCACDSSCHSYVHAHANELRGLSNEG